MSGTINQKDREKIYNYFTQTEWEKLSESLKSGGLNDEKFLKEIAIFQKIAKSLNKEEFCNHSLTLDDVAVKLTPQEMDLAKGGRLYPPSHDYEANLLALAKGTPPKDWPFPIGTTGPTFPTQN